MQSARDILRLFVTNQIDEWGVVEWAGERHHSQFAEAIDLPHFERKSAIESVLIAMVTPDEPAIAERYRAIDLIGKVLSRSIEPIVLSNWVNRLDAQWVAEKFYPEWLSDLWNALDWCDEGWTLSNQPHLQETLPQILETLIALD